MGKVTVIFGSPRKNGNTHLLVREAQRGLKDSGFDSDIFYLNEMVIKGCQACYFCKRHETAECAVKDDMQSIYTAVNESDGIIVASPIYFGGITGQTKLWLDRMFPYIDMNVGSRMRKGKKAAFIFTQNQPVSTLFEAHMASVRQMLGYIGFDIRDSMLVCNVDKGYKPMVTENEELMKRAYALGRNMMC
jgi:multimeric flavodoxin WrbA